MMITGQLLYMVFYEIKRWGGCLQEKRRPIDLLITSHHCCTFFSLFDDSRRHYDIEKVLGG